MSGLHDFSNAATAMSAAYASYVLQAAAHTTRSLQLGEQLVACVARRQLTPATLQSSLTQFAQADGGESAAKATAATARFVAGLAAGVFLPTKDDALGDIEPANLVGSLQRIVERARARNARAVEAYQAQLLAVAAGTLTPDEFHRTNRKLYSGTIASELGRVAQLWFEFLSELDELRARASEQHQLGVLRELTPIGFAGDVVELTGPVNSTVSTVVTVENVRPKRVVIHCAVSDVRRADGVGPAFMPRLVLEPDNLALDADAEESVRLSLWVDGAVYEIGSPYIGMLHLTRDGEPRLEVPLRISATLSTA